MYELIKIENTTIGSEAVPTVSARELHEFLESKQDFSTWIKKRIKDGRFLENRGFTSLHKKMEREIGATSRIEYYITIEMAKHLGMMERNEKGFEVRDYFIACEKQLKETRATEKQLILNTVLATSTEERMLALGEYRDAIVLPLLEFKEQALPKVSYYDNVPRSCNHYPNSKGLRYDSY